MNSLEELLEVHYFLVFHSINLLSFLYKQLFFLSSICCDAHPQINGRRSTHLPANSICIWNLSNTEAAAGLQTHIYQLKHDFCFLNQIREPTESSFRVFCSDIMWLSCCLVLTLSTPLVMSFTRPFINSSIIGGSRMV